MIEVPDIGRPHDPADLKKALALAAVELIEVGQVPRHERGGFHVQGFFKAVERLHQHVLVSCFRTAGRSACLAYNLIGRHADLGSRSERVCFAMPMPPALEICAPICSAIIDFQMEPALPLP